jgi:hypothetical protein
LGPFFFIFRTSARPVLGPAIQWAVGVKRQRRETDHSMASGEVNLYIHSPIRLLGVVLNWLSTGTTLPFYV